MVTGSKNKLKLFVENFIIYGFGGIISKIIPLIMVPVVTRIMPGTEYFGISDLSNTVVNFCSSVAIMGMYDAMYRLFFDSEDENYKRSVCSTALIITMETSLVIFCVMLLLRDMIARYFFGNPGYAYIVYLSAMATLVGATNSIISAPVRMQNKRKIFLLANSISPILSYAISIPLLLKGYYVIALPVAAVVSGITLEVVFYIINREWFNYQCFDKKLLKPLFNIAIPLLPNFLIYWIFNSCDRVMIANMMGVRFAGIYSVGAKLGHVSQLIYTAFAGGWQFFAFSTMNEKKQVENNSRIFEYLGILSFITTSFICAWSYLIYRVLFPEQYLSGYVVAPYLFLAPLLQMLFQVAANQFLVIKKTWPNMLILATGAILNIIVNWLLIPLLGMEGASLATLIGYIVSDVICVAVLCKMNLMVRSNRLIISSMLMLLYLIIWRLFFSKEIMKGMLFSLVLLLIEAIMYRKDLLNFWKIIRG